jgi:hypothetical protein
MVKHWQLGQNNKQALPQPFTSIFKTPNRFLPEDKRILFPEKTSLP